MVHVRTVALAATTAFLFAFALGMLFYPATIGRLLVGLAAALAVAALGMMFYLLVAGRSEAA